MTNHLFQEAFPDLSTLKGIPAHFFRLPVSLSACQPVIPALVAEAGESGVQGQLGLPVKTPVSKPKQMQNSTNVSHH